MDEEAYESRVEEYKKMAANQPQRYLKKLRWFMLLGRMFPLVVVLLLLALVGGVIAAMIAAGSGGAVAFKVVLVAGIPAYVILRSMFVRIPVPDGVYVAKSDALRLWSTVADTARKLDAPVPSKILLNAEMNAFIVSRPRLLGLLGYTHYLGLGVPMLMILSPAQLEAILAHELAHLSGGHGAEGARAYRLFHSVVRMVATLQGSGRRWSSGLLMLFYKWYMPRFDAMSFALRRQHEIDADTGAVRITSSEDVAEGLIKFEVLGPRFGRAIPRQMLEAVASGTEPRTEGWITRACAALHQPDDVRHFRFITIAGALEELSNEDEHPSLGDRLAIAGIKTPLAKNGSLQPSPEFDALIERIASEVGVSAGEQMFGNNFPSYVERVEQKESWVDDEDSDLWKPWAEKSVELLERVKSAVNVDRVPKDHISEYAELASLSGQSFDEALTMVRKIAALDPDNSRVVLELARFEAQSGNREAYEAAAERARKLDPYLLPAILEFGQWLYAGLGDNARYQQVTTELTSVMAEFKRAQAEREKPMSVDDKYEVAELRDDERERLSAVLQSVNYIREAWVLRRVSKYAADRGDNLVMIQIKHDVFEKLTSGQAPEVEELFEKFHEELNAPALPHEEWQVFFFDNLKANDFAKKLVRDEYRFTPKAVPVTI